MAVDRFSDGQDELLQVPENPAPKLIAGEVTKEALDHIEPSSRSRRKPHMEAPVLLQPALYVFVFVGRVVIADQVDFLASRHCLIDHAQEAKPLLMPVLLLA